MSSRAKNSGSVAPKERINISYKPAVGNAKEGVELPFKLLVLGEFTNQPSDLTIEEKKLVNINKHNFSDVMESMDLKLDFTVDNTLTDAGDSIDVSLNINELSDFEPDSIVEQVDELKKILQLRDALKALKGPIGNSPQMRKHIQALLADESSRDKLKKELGVQKTDTAEEK